jgi:hypothetical protein
MESCWGGSDGTYRRMDHKRKRTAYVQQLPWIPSLRLLGKAETIKILSELWQGYEKGGKTQ